MLNGRIVLFGILGVLFVTAAFGQEQADPNIITVTEKIDLRELNTTVKTLNTTVGELNKTVGELKTTVEDLKVTVGKIDERTQGIAKVQHVILASFIGPLVVAILAAIIIPFIIRNRNSEGRPAATNTTLVNPSEPNPTQVLQNTASDTTSTETSLSGSSEEEKLLEQLKNYSPDTEEKA